MDPSCLTALEGAILGLFLTIDIVRLARLRTGFIMIGGVASR
jgi:hypothetical protein